MLLKWKQRGNCNGEPAYIFYVKHPRVEERARAICMGCPVIEECFLYALQHNEMGIWGGLTEEERKKLKLSSLVQEKPVTELLHNNRRERERLANASRVSPPYTIDQRNHILAFSGRVVALQVPLFGKAYRES